MDPDFYTEDAIDDVYDELFDDCCSDLSDFDTKIEQDIEDSLYTTQLNADQLALAIGFGETIVNEQEIYDVDENTDEENWRKTAKLYPLQGRYHSNGRSNLAAFEQYINEITSGQCKGPWVQDERL